MDKLDEAMSKVNKLRQNIINESIMGVLISEQCNFSYITCGARSFLGLASTKACGSILVTKNKVYLISNNIESNRLINEELPKGFCDQIILQWQEDSSIRQEAIKIANGKVVTDIEINRYFLDNRVNLCMDEIARYRSLCKESTECLESTLKLLKPGVNEFEVAGMISASLWKKGMEPISLFIAADDRRRMIRHYVPTNKKAYEQIIASICARKNGLVSSVTRTVSFRKPLCEVKNQYNDLLQVENQIFENIQIKMETSKLFQQICAAYEQNNLSGEWLNHHQGGLTGYMPREIRFDSKINFIIRENQAFAFNPSCQNAKLEDTILMTDRGVEIMTESSDWPSVVINGRVRPNILILK